MHRASTAIGHKLAPLRLGQRTRNEVAVLDARQRADAVAAQVRTQAAQKRELHVGPGLDLFFDQLKVVLRAGAVKDDGALGVARAQDAVVQVERAIGAHQREQIRAHRAEAVVERRVLRVQLLGNRHRLLRPGQHLRNVALQQRVVHRAHMLIDTPWQGASAVHALAGCSADQFLAELAQQHALARDLGMRLRHANDVAPVQVRVKTEQQIGRSQIEKMQGVRLHDLSVMHQAADLLRRYRDRRAEHAVKRLGRCQLVRDRADAAQALHHHRHFPIGSALDEFLEATELDDVQPRLLHAVVFVQQQGDLAMALDARDRVDRDTAQALRVGGGFKRAVHDRSSMLSRSATGRGPGAGCARPSGRSGNARRRRPAVGSRAKNSPHAPLR